MKTDTAVHRIIPLHRVPVAGPDIDAELERYEAEERARLGLAGSKRNWHDEIPQHFTAAQRAHTTILCGGLTLAHDKFIVAALSGLGYRLQQLDVPDNEALRLGKEFGNRAQCNPTYFTVGNLVKHLTHLRDEQGLSTQEIVDNYLFVTSGACGPCRFGMYATEYRKALRDAGFDGFRVMLFQLYGGLKQATGEKPGLDLTPRFFLKLVQAVMLGDVFNLMGYRLRPYEREPGSTDAALLRCQDFIRGALEQRRSLLPVLLRCRRELAQVATDRTRIKPKVAVIGEFWAMTTEGDGNYNLQRFLEQEGAEVDIQPVTNWLLFMIWWEVFNTRERHQLRGSAVSAAPTDTATRKHLAGLWFADKALRAVFNGYARLTGLKRYHLADLDGMAQAAKAHYDLNVSGGEGYMEVGKFILAAQQRKAGLVLSVKPFGCMPSSGVSDGVQSYVTQRHPHALFLPIETSGDGAVNVYSRVQMMLFKARARAVEEVDQASVATGLTLNQLPALARWLPWLGRSLYQPAHSYRASTSAANLLYAAGRWHKWLGWLGLARPRPVAARVPD